MPVVWCLRHGESTNVVAGASGALPTAPLTPLGREQARRAAPALTGIRTVYASTALRARQTAELLGGTVVTRPELVEFGVGGREGEVDAGLRRETAEVLRARVVDGDLDRRVADGETGHEAVWGAPLPHAAPFAVGWDEKRWHCPRWPG